MGYETDMAGWCRDELQRHKGTWPAIARGAGVQKFWLYKFIQDPSRDAAVSHVQRLYVHLKRLREAEEWRGEFPEDETPKPIASREAT